MNKLQMQLLVDGKVISIDGLAFVFCSGGNLVYKYRNDPWLNFYGDNKPWVEYRKNEILSTRNSYKIMLNGGIVLGLSPSRELINSQIERIFNGFGVFYRISINGIMEYSVNNMESWEEIQSGIANCYADMDNLISPCSKCGRCGCFDVRSLNWKTL